MINKEVKVLSCLVCDKTINMSRHGTHRWYESGKLCGFTHLGKCTEEQKSNRSFKLARNENYVLST